MPAALIGATGFVGTSLLRQRSFDSVFHSTDISSLPDRSYSLVVCAGAPAQKWTANREPRRDRASLASLFDALGRLECEQFVLISTVDVFPKPVEVDESSRIDASALQPYGLHRWELEQLVRARFARALIVRLPGLVGPGLKKNTVFDLRHGNEVEKIDSRGVFQFYPVVQLWRDIELALASAIDLVHLTAEPMTVAEIARAAFGRSFTNELAGQAARYDFRTRHAELFGGRGAYQYSKRDSLLAIRAYAQSEPARDKCR